MSFSSAYPLLRAAAMALRPPRRTRVSQGAAATLVIRQPGGFSGPWSATEAPYMVEPMDMLASRRHEAVCFVGPARTGKTLGLLDGWFAYAATCDPGDMLVVQMSQEKAREFSKTRIDRAIRNSPRLRELMSLRGHDDNTHDKLLRHGMWLKIGWPSATQLSGSDYRYVAVTDYDRMPDDVDGEGAVFALALKRTQTFLSRGMCMVESSPGRECSDPNWTAATAHEAPPTTGVLGIYNRSDRRRWYWRCPECRDWFEAAPGLSLFATLPPEKDLLEIVRGADLPALADEHARIVCPHCAVLIGPEHKHAMNLSGLWLADGQRVSGDGVVEGEPMRSSIAGYWLGGVAAAYQSWHSLVLRYLQGLREYVLSGSELSLQATVNTDQGMPYLSRRLSEQTGQDVRTRVERIDRYHVPVEARFLVASVDVQGGQNGRFVCEVRAFGPHLETWLIDRFSLTSTERGGAAAQVDPAAHPEDWDILTHKLVSATYRLADGQEMRVLRVAVDTGGEAGTTPNAYAWYRRLRRIGLHSRVMLVKGGSHQQDKPVVRGNARDTKGRVMLDMPLWLVNTDFYKDVVAASLRRAVPGPGYFHAPSWLPSTYFDELRAEVRDSRGRWKKLRARNEALDLWVYALAAVEDLGYGAKGRLSWEAAPAWAKPQDAGNSEIVTPEQRRAEQISVRAVARATQPAAGDDFGRSEWNERF